MLDKKRYSEGSEKTYRRQYRQEFNFIGLNIELIEAGTRKGASVISGDCSFIPKIATRKAKAPRQSQRIAWEVIERAQQMLDQLPDKSKPDAAAETVERKPTRIDHYLEHLKATRSYFPAGLQDWSVDGFFRDAKQFTGLCDAQTRDPPKLDFHVNASLTTLNLAKYEHQLRQQQTDAQPQSSPFSMSSYKRIAFNDPLLERFISQLALTPTLIKSHPNYESLRSYGIIAT